MEENIAVVVSLQVFEGVMQFLATQPYNSVAGLIQNLSQSQGLTETQLTRLQPEPEPEEKAPE